MVYMRKKYGYRSRFRKRAVSRKRFRSYGPRARRRYKTRGTRRIATKALSIAKYVRRKCRPERRIAESLIGDQTRSGAGMFGGAGTWEEKKDEQPYPIMPTVAVANRDGDKVTQYLNELVLRFRVPVTDLDTNNMSSFPGIAYILIVQFKGNTIFNGANVDKAAYPIDCVIKSPGRFETSRKVKQSDPGYRYPYKILAKKKIYFGKNPGTGFGKPDSSATPFDTAQPSSNYTITHPGYTENAVKRNYYLFHWKDLRKHTWTFKTGETTAHQNPVFLYVGWIGDNAHDLTFSGDLRFYYTDL